MRTMAVLVSSGVCCFCLWALVWAMPMGSQPGVEVCWAAWAGAPGIVQGLGNLHLPLFFPPSSLASPLSPIQNVLSGQVAD